jgi:S-adenosyl methyltransferase
MRMSDEGGREARRVRPSLIDVTVPNAARAADFLYGGRDNFAADRKAVSAVAASAPAVERIPAEARAFRHRVIRYLVAEARVTQFLDIGTGLVPPGATHELAQSIDPESRIVYTESDPMVRLHARALIRSAKSGSVSCVDGDIADVDAIVAGALPTLDLTRPVAVLLLSTLAHVPTTIAAARAVSAMMAAVPSGSYAVIYHLASDLDPAMPAAARHWNKTTPKPITLRSSADVATLVSGLELVPPGVVPVTEWRPDLAAVEGQDASGAPAAGRTGTVQPVPVHGVVARKPLRTGQPLGPAPLTPPRAGENDSPVERSPFDGAGPDGARPGGGRQPRPSAHARARFRAYRRGAAELPGGMGRRGRARR